MTARPHKVDASEPKTATTRAHLDVSESIAIVPQMLLMDRLVDVLIEKAKSGVHWPELYERAVATLYRVGLPTRKSLLAAKRLRNAELYASAEDYGAAAFELRLIRTQLA